MHIINENAEGQIQDSSYSQEVERRRRGGKQQEYDERMGKQEAGDTDGVARHRA